MATPVILQRGIQGPNVSADFARSYSESFVVTMPSAGGVKPPRSGLDILVAVGGKLPRIGDPFISDPFAQCTKVDPKQDNEAPFVWYVEITYESPGLHGKEPGTVAVPPWEQPPQIRWSSVPYQAIALKDLDNKAFKDAAGTWISPTPAVPKQRLLLEIQRAVEIFDPLRDFKMANKINSTLFMNFPPNTLLLHAPTADRQWFQDIPYWQTTFAIEVSDHDYQGDNRLLVGEFWDKLKVLNAGPRYLDDNGNVVAGDDDLGTIDGVNILLRGEGDPGGGLAGKKLPKDGDPNFLEFRVYERVDFNTLNLLGVSQG